MRRGLLTKLRGTIGAIVRPITRPWKPSPRLDEIESALHRTIASTGDDHTQLMSTIARLDTLRAQVVDLNNVVHAADVWASVARGTEWARTAPLAHRPLISVILPTHNRAEMLPAAVASVRAQSYEHWELVIVDDGSVDGTAEVLAEIADSDGRIRAVRTSGLGGGGARNAGLDVATGSFVAFLDDDNVMTPHWLRAIAEFTGRAPDCEAMYGAQLRTPVALDQHTPIEVLYVPVFDPDGLRQDNYIDLGVLAVRAGHPQLRFDPELRALQDWEMIVRIADVTPLTPLPALASCYSSASDDRVSVVHGGDLAVARMRERFAAARRN